MSTLLVALILLNLQTQEPQRVYIDMMPGEKILDVARITLPKANLVRVNEQKAHTADCAVELKDDETVVAEVRFEPHMVDGQNSCFLEVQWPNGMKSEIELGVFIDY